MADDGIHYTIIPSPVGDLLLAAAGAGLRHIRFAPRCGGSGRRPAPEPGWREDAEPFAAVIAQLNDYFAGRRRVFDLRLAPRASPFQAQVLAALRHIPYGETRSYGEVARAIGKPRAARAVGAANAKNPLPIVIPCHRVIGGDGRLTGFGGGLAAKRHLLDLERRELRQR